MKEKDKRALKTYIKEFLLMVLGCVLYACGTVMFVAPNGIVAGGITGLATLVNLVNENIPIGLISIALNVPVLLLGWRTVGTKFAVNFVLTFVVLGLIISLYELFGVVATTNPLLASVYGGILMGLGSGLFVRYNFNGGTELLGRVFAKWFKTDNVPLCVGACDGTIVLSGLLAPNASLETVLYALIVVFICTKLSELVLTGFSKSKLCFIITDKGKEIADELIRRSPRGVTMLEGQGMYTGNDHNVLMTCVKSRQLSMLKEIVKSVDEHAFVIINESVEVRGQGFKEWNEKQ